MYEMPSFRKQLLSGDSVMIVIFVPQLPVLKYIEMIHRRSCIQQFTSAIQQTCEQPWILNNSFRVIHFGKYES